MIEIEGERYGTAAEIADALGPDVTTGMVRNWARRDGLPCVRRGREVWYPLAAAAAIEVSKRTSPRGRPRGMRLDDHALVTA